MRNDLHGWFVIGAAAAILSSLSPGWLEAMGYRVPPSQVPLVIGGTFTVLIALTLPLARLLVGLVLFRVERRNRPHTLFTPLYEQR